MSARRRSVIGFDSETHLIRPDRPVPPMVCYSAAGGYDTFEHLLDFDPRLRPWAPALGAEGPREFLAPDLWVRTRGGTSDGEWEIVVPRDRAVDLHTHLVSSGAIMVAHNQAFDWSGLLALCPELRDIHTHLLETGGTVCTRIRERLWAIATDNLSYDQRIQGRMKGYGLAHCIMSRFGVDITGDKAKLSTLIKAKTPKSEWPWRYRYDELDGIPLDQWPRKPLLYAAEDATWHRRLYIDQATPLTLDVGVVVNDDGTVVNEREQCCFDHLLREMAIEGVGTDPEAVDVFASEVGAMVAEAEFAGKQAGFMVLNNCPTCLGTGLSGEVPHLSTCGICEGLDHATLLAQGRYGSYKNGKPKNPAGPKSKKSIKRLRALISHAFAGDPPLTEKGGVSTSSETLQASGNALLMEYAAGSFAIKLRDTYLPILRRGAEGPIHSDPNCLLKTGRTSWKNPAMQTPPQRGGFRACFVPKPGNVFASIDFDGQEMGTLAQANLLQFGYSKMAEAINAGQNLHLAFAAKNYLHMDYDEALAIYEDPTHPRYEEVCERRDRAKPGNFGFPGMMGTATFVEYARGYGIQLGFMEADEQRDTWFELFPENTDVKNWTQRNTNNSLDGRYNVRQFGSGRVRGGCSYSSGPNTRFQGLGADASKAAGWALYKECYLNHDSPLFGVRMWLFIHDEYLFEGPRETAHIWAPYASKVMVDAAKPYTPDVHVGAQAALMNRWHKKAKPVFKEGRLVPWTPEKK